MGPAWQAIQPDLVPPREFGQAVALSSLTFNTGRAIGPALAGALVASAGAGLGVRRQRGVVPRRRRRAGVVAAAPHQRAAVDRVAAAAPCGPACATASTPPALRGILVRTLVFAAPAAAIQALLPAVVRDQLGWGRAATASCSAASASAPRSPRSLRPRIDAVLTSDQSVTVSSVADRRRARARRHHRSRRGSPAPALFVAGGAWTTATVTLNVATQRALPWWVRARGLGLYLVVLAGGIAVGSARVGRASPAGASPSPTSIAAAVLSPASPPPRRWQPRRRAATSTCARRRRRRRSSTSSPTRPTDRCS